MQTGKQRVRGSGLGGKRHVLVMLGWHDPAAYRGIGRFAREAGWHLDSRLFYTEVIPEGWQGDGMIVSEGARADVTRYIRRQAKCQSTVIMGANNPGIEAPSVMTNNHRVGELAARHFLDCHHRHFAWFNAFGNAAVAVERRDGFLSVLKAAGQSCERLDYRKDIDESRDWRRRRNWLAARLRSLPRPLALFTVDDQLASEAIEVCVEQGWAVPEEISVVGVGNLEFACECAHVPISSVDTREEETAWQAASVLDALMKGKAPKTDRIVLEPAGVVIRQSSDTLATGNIALRQALRFMKGNFGRAIGVEEIARAAGISRRTLYQLFEAEFGETPASRLMTFRLDEARRLLGQTETKIATVAEMCGFGTHRTLDRCFRRLEGVSPAAWRRTEEQRP